MSYSVYFSSADDRIYRGIRSLLQDIKSKSSTTIPTETFALLEKECNIKLQRQGYADDQRPKWQATFANEKEYTMFLLRWA
jgi:hypothetical protein